MVLGLQQLEFIFDPVAGVGGGELELLGEVGGALRVRVRVREGEGLLARPRPTSWLSSAGPSSTLLGSLQGAGRPPGKEALLPLVILGGRHPILQRPLRGPREAPLRQTGHRPAFKASLEDAPSYHPTLPGRTPITPVSSGDSPQSCPAPGVPRGVPPSPSESHGRKTGLGSGRQMVNVRVQGRAERCPWG